MLDPRIVEEVASALATEPGLIEKEWHVVRAIGVIARLDDHGDARPVFSGGTSLSVAWRLIKRFSEDVDFKVALPAELTYSQARARRRNYRDNVVLALTKSDFTLVGEPISRNVDHSGIPPHRAPRRYAARSVSRLQSQATGLQSRNGCDALRVSHRLRRHRNREKERGPPPRDALYPDMTPMGFDNALHDRQA